MANKEYTLAKQGAKVVLHMDLAEVACGERNEDPFSRGLRSPIIQAGCTSAIVGVAYVACTVSAALTTGPQSAWVVPAAVMGGLVGIGNTIFHSDLLYKFLAAFPANIDTSHYAIKRPPPESQGARRYFCANARPVMVEKIDINSATYADVYKAYAHHLFSDARKVATLGASLVLTSFVMTIPEVAQGFPEVASLFPQAATALLQGTAAAVVPWVAGKLLRGAQMARAYRELEYGTWKVTTPLQVTEAEHALSLAELLPRLLFPRPAQPTTTRDVG